MEKNIPEVQSTGGRTKTALLLGVSIISVIGFLIWNKVDADLNEALEHTISKQINMSAHSLGQQFSQELSAMEYGALIVSSGRMSSSELVDIIDQKEQSGIWAGVENLDDLMYGDDSEDRIPMKNSPQMMDNIPEGKPAVTYWEGRGLVFAAPITDENTGEVSGLLYKIYNNRAMQEQFNLTSYDGEGSVALFDETGALGSITADREGMPGVKKICKDSEINSSFQKIRNDIQNNHNNAISVSYNNNRYFLFGAKVPGTDFLVMGYVPWLAVAKEIQNTLFAMLIAFGIMACGIILFARYVFKPRMSNDEDDMPAVIEQEADSTNVVRNRILANTVHDNPAPVNPVDSIGSDEQAAEHAKSAGNLSQSIHRSIATRVIYHEKFTAPDAKILVVDDTAMNLTVVKGLLKKTQIQVDMAENGQDCLDMVQANKYDLILIDYRMPDIDGIEALHKIRELEDYPNEDTPIVALMANTMLEARDEYIGEGFADCLTKPIHTDHLENIILKFIPEEKVTVEKEAEEVEYYEYGMPEPLPELVTEPLNKLVPEQDKVAEQEPEEKQEPVQEEGQEQKQDEQEQKSEEQHEADDNGDAIDREHLKEAYEAMRSAAIASDHDGLTFVLDTLSEHDFSPEELKIYEALKEAASISDWEKIKEILDKEIQD